MVNSTAYWKLQRDTFKGNLCYIKSTVPHVVFSPQNFQMLPYSVCVEERLRQSAFPINLTRQSCFHLLWINP